MTEIAAIAVVARNHVIGDGQDQPIKISEDWKRFKQITMGHPLIVGRVTFEAIGRFLPGRKMIVISHEPERLEVSDDNFAVPSLEVALAMAEALDDEIAFIAGGGQIYRAAWDYLDILLLTEVDQDADGEVTFPELDDAWEEIEREPRDGFDFVRYERVDAEPAEV